MTTDNVIPENELARRRRVNELVDDIYDLQHDSIDRIFELHELGVRVTEALGMIADKMLPPFAGAVRDNPGLLLIAELAIGLRLHNGDVQAAVNRLSDLATTPKSGVSPEMMNVLSGILDGAVPPAPGIDPAFMAGVTAYTAYTANREGQRARVVVSVPGGIDPDGDDEIAEVDMFATARIRRTLDRLFAEAPKLQTPGKGVDGSQAQAIQANIVLRCGVSMFGALSRTPEGTLRLLAPNEQDGKKVMIEHFFDLGEVCDIALVREVSMSGLFRS